VQDGPLAMATSRVLFVCRNNLARGPVAEHICRHLAAERGVKVSVASAGTSSWLHPSERSSNARAPLTSSSGAPVGLPALPSIVSAVSRSPLLQSGSGSAIDLSTHVSRQLHPQDFEMFDLIVACSPRRHRMLKEMMSPLPHEGVTTGDDSVYRAKLRGLHGYAEGVGDVLNSESAPPELTVAMLHKSIAAMLDEEF